MSHSPTSNAIHSALGNLFFQTACSTQDFILVAALHSVSRRHPGRIEKHDGYYGMAVINVFTMVSTIFAPCLTNCIKSKWISLIGVLCSTLYFITFQFLERWIFFVACAVFGIGLAIYNVGFEGFLLEISTIKSLDRNHSITSIITCLAIFLSGIIYILITVMYNEEGIDTEYRSYSDLEITHFYEVFTIVCIISMCVFVLLPNDEIEGNIASLDVPHKTLKGQIGAMLKMLVEKKILILVPFFVYSSLFDTLWVTIIPTTLHYTDSLSEYIYITAYFSMCFAIGSFTAAFMTLKLSERFNDFAMRPLMVFSSIVQLIIYILIVLMIPKNSSIEPTDEPSLLIQPSLIHLLVLASLFGIADTANNTTRTIVCARLIPDRKHQVFGASRFYSSLAVSSVFFASPHLNIYAYAGILTGFLCLAIASFLFTSRRVKRYEKTVNQTFPELELPPKSIVISKEGEPIIQRRETFVD
ncbi:hypothetical protein PRIPAC_81143 [Pristionchus pacificus]|nr:hypothetical protein PRIPAC_81143 [Pristionchus pacificus]